MGIDVRGPSRVIEGDAIDVLATLPERSVHCCVTSPPYWGLRDYGDAGKLGLEHTLDEFIANQVEVFRGVWRVLRDDATLWLNMGDSFATSSPSGTQGQTGGQADRTFTAERIPAKRGLPAKNLFGLPWRLAFALQADGWYLRSDIIWHKPNPMPESCTDRPTKSHEYVFLMTKRAHYFYDADAVRAVGSGRCPGNRNYKYDGIPGHETKQGILAQADVPQNTRNLRTVWRIPTQPFSKAHFATFPEALVFPCIKAGTSERGCCSNCGTPWVRLVEKDRQPPRPGKNNVNDPTGMANRDNRRHVTDVKTTGWKAGCTCVVCDDADFGGLGCTNSFPVPVPCTVLDPYCGSGTTGVVATQLQRNFIGIDINPEYCAMARHRIENPTVAKPVPDCDDQIMFDLVPNERT